MVRSVCCVPDCPNKTTDNPDLDYHHLPYSDERRRKWLENIGRLDRAEKSWQEVKSLKICGAHFAPDQYRSPLTKKLNIGAIPTIFVHDSEILLKTNPAGLQKKESEEIPTIDTEILLLSPTNPAGLQKKESEEIPTIELPGTSQAFGLKKIISTNISNILRTGLGESSDLTVPAAVIETAELEEFVEIPTIEQKGDVQQFVVVDYPNGITDPIALDLLQGFKPGFAITVVAQTCDIFKFEIKDCSGNILLHVITKFSENCVILNSFFCGWGPEERTTNMPIQKNEKFSLVCTYEEYGYRVFIDGVQIAFYKHRSTNPPEECEIGGAQIFKVIYGKGQPLWAIKNTTLDFGPHGIPSYTTTLPQLVPGSWISMSGLVNVDCVYTGIDLLNEHEDILFHFNPRFNQGQVVRNSFLNGGWGVEETDGGMPLTKGKPFCITYVLETSCIRVYVNGIEFTTYDHRALYASKTTIRISTGIKLLKFSFVQ